MTSVTSLGRADASATWASLQRHQVAGLVVFVGLGATWLFSPSSSNWLLVGAAAAAAAAVPLGEGITVATGVGSLVQFALRRKWRVTDVRQLAQRTSTTRRLEHVGRLDLSGRDAQIVAQLREVAAGLAAQPSGGTFTWQQVHTDEQPQTLLTATTGDLPGWTVRSTTVPFPQPNCLRLIHERWRGVTTIDGSCTVLRLFAFAPQQQRAALAAVQRLPVPTILTVQGTVLPSTRAHRLAGRAVHRSGTDASAAHAFGLRRSAQRVVETERVVQREQLVAMGRSLLQLGVFVTVVGDDPGHVRERVRLVVREARNAGLVLHQGRGRQAEWFGWTLPGGPVG